MTVDNTGVYFYSVNNGQSSNNLVFFKCLQDKNMLDIWGMKINLSCMDFGQQSCTYC